MAVMAFHQTKKANKNTTDGRTDRQLFNLTHLFSLVSKRRLSMRLATACIKHIKFDMNVDKHTQETPAYRT